MKNTWRFSGNELNYVREVIDSGFGSGTSGSMNNRFEEAFAQKIGARHAITFNSGTSTLHAALFALGVEAGDEVIVPPLTVISNVDAIFALNAVPIFADVDPRTFNIDPEDIRQKMSQKTKAIMPVSLYGLSCDIDPIKKIAEEYGVGVLNDAAQAFGSTYKGRPIAELTDITSYSTENSKHITTGDGGIVVTDNPDYAIAMRKFNSLGYAAMKSGDGRIRINKDIFQDPDYRRHDELGLNYRMPEVAAALGLAQTERMEHFIELRIAIAAMFEEVVKDCDYLAPQYTPKNCLNTYWTYAVQYLRDDISWKEFRGKYMEKGGDSIYAAWVLSYEETVMASGAYKRHAPYYYDDLDYERGLCPVAESIQPRLMQFVTNYGSPEEARPFVDALHQTIEYFS